MKSKKKKAYNFGLWAEHLVVLYLKAKLYKILARRYKSKSGEIDIIARKGNNIVFIEVKARPSLNQAHESFSTYQQNRISNSANVFISQNPKMYTKQMRFDLILVSKSLRVKHIKNAWGSW